MVILETVQFSRINEPQILKINLFDKFGNESFESQSMIVFLKEASKERKLYVPENESSFVCRFTPKTSQIDISLYHDRWKAPVHYNFSFSPERKFKIHFRNKNNLMKNLIKKFFEFTSIYPNQILTEEKAETSDVIFNIGDNDKDLLESTNKFEKTSLVPVFILKFKKRGELIKHSESKLKSKTVITFAADPNHNIENSEENRIQMIKLSQLLFSLPEN